MKEKIKDFLDNKFKVKNFKFNEKLKDKKEEEESNDIFSKQLMKKNDGKKRINKEKVKEVALVISAVVLIGLGYINFSDNNSVLKKNNNKTVETYSKSSNNIGDVQLVNGESVLVENAENELDDEDVDKQDVNNNDTQETSIVNNENKESNVLDNKDGNTDLSSVSTSSSSKAYFTELKLNRDTIYSQMLDTYQKIVDSSSISNEQKSIAVQEIEKINSTKNAILVAEELIRLKGFENVVIYVNRKFG